METGTTTRFADGSDPSVAGSAGTILARDPSGFLLLDSWGNVQARYDVERADHGAAVVSPSGNMILADIQRHMPFYAGGRLTFIRMSSLNDKHVLDTGYSYRVDWTMADKEESNQGHYTTR